MKALFFLLLIICPLSLLGQAEFGKSRSNGMQFDNDVFFKTDRYYTTGLKIYHESPKLIKLFNKKKVTQERLTLNHKIYTPSKFNQEIIDFDRPFVSSLSLAYSTTTSDIEKKIKVKHRLELGLQGKNSGGRTVQNFIHWLLPASDEIKDWKYQLGTDFIANYSLGIEKGIFHSKNVMVNALSTVQVGTPKLTADIGAHIRIGKLFNHFQFLDYSRDDWSLFIYSKPKLMLTAYNTLLQGGPFTHRQAFTLSTINHITYEIETGLYWSIQRWAFEGAFTYQSPEANNLDNHRWGSIKVNYLLKK